MTHDPFHRPLTVACCEDDPAIRRLLEECCRLAGHRTLSASSGAEAIERFSTDATIDVVVMDVGLPDSDGRDVCRALRGNGLRAPVLFLSALGQVHDIVHGFAAGGLDYIVKPFAVPELLARIEALTRRGPVAAPSPELQLDAARFALRRGEAERVLTPTEFRIVAELLARPGEVVRRQQLVHAAWTPGARVQGNTLDTYLHRLRRHLQQLDATESIETVRGVGFVLRGV